MSGKYALVIANTEYGDPGLAQLKAPGQDAREFWRVLSSPDICAFDDVNLLFNDDSFRAVEQIEIFFEKRKPDDLLLLYFSGHGVKDEQGALYLAVKNTNRRRLRSTAIPSDFIRNVMDDCRSKRQVLILDCCNSGAFAQGTKAETGGSIGTASAFKGTGYGRIVLTASDSTQFAWEGDKVIGETDNSLFTHFLIKGLEGAADRSGQGHIVLDDLYDYAYEQIVNVTPKQTPGKWSFKQQGEIILREKIRIEDVAPKPLPAELLEEIEDKRPYVREAALQRLMKLANGSNLGLARSAREALERMAENDDSRTLSRMAFQALETIKQHAAPNEQVQADHLAAQKAEAERLATVKAERNAKEEADRLATLEAEHKAKEEADRLAAQIAEAECLATLEAEHKAKEEADGLAAQKAEAERLATLEAERKAKEEAKRLAAQKAEAERLAKLEADRKAKEEADRLAAQKAEAKRLAKLETEHKAMERARRRETDRAAIVSALTAKLDTLLGAPKKTVVRSAFWGLGTVTIIAIAFMTIRAFSSPEPVTPLETFTPPVTNIPNTQAPTSIPDQPVLVTIDPPLEIGSTYQYIDGSVLVAVPAGEFNMGASGTDNPRHTVTIEDYWISSTEVTNQQYALCVNLGKCTTPNLDDNPGYSNYELSNNPVTGVTYDQAANYCEFVNGRLPSEAEWEKAAQNPTAGNYPWGEAVPTCDLLNFNGCLNKTSNVTTYTNGASMYGALDMSGNVFEWVADWYNAEYYATSPSDNPTGPADGTLRSIRSSSYASDVDQVDATLRNSENPENHRADLGFRCVVDNPGYFAPFCEIPPIYANASAQDKAALQACPDLEIKPAPFCSNNTPLTNVTFVGPTEATIESQDCIPSNNPNLFTCKTQGEIVSISAACQLNDLGTPSCPSGYVEQGNLCIVETDVTLADQNCLTGEYDTAGQCCALPQGESGSSPVIQACPVGTFYATKENACMPLPVPELITVSYAVTLPNTCTTTGGGGGGAGGGTSGCQATEAQINACNAQAPFYSWNSDTCSCDPK